ncbi:hypothetical protein TRVL_01646 [Trypanosoma vivax]|nr:hypothetical protein TRVL_01646 [Trypanosoma vivax]
MVPKRVFQRPALSIECERGVQLGATVQASVSHMEGFSVMHRINGLRQSLSSIVASRAASSERYATPLVSQDSCEIKAPDTTAEQLLVASQQRVEDLLKENHRLELLCMNQAHVMQNASVQSTQSLKQRKTSATTSAVEGGGCALGHWTPKVSTNKATARLQPECADGVEKWPTSTESFFVPEDVGMAVKRLVCTAVSVVPEMGMHEGDVTGFRTDDGALKTSEVLLFVEGNLERWVRASRECVDVETAGSMVCRSLAHFESNQREWCTTLSELIKRLQKWQWLQRQTILEGERRTLALKREMELLSCEMSKAVEERAECECRCAQLERALSKAMEKQCEDNVVVQRLQQECSKLRSDADALFHLAGAKQRRGAATDKPDCHRELSTVPGGPCSLKEHTTSVPGLSAISVAVGTEESLGTDVTGSAAHPNLLLAEEHVLLHPLYIDMSKKAVELEAKVEELSTSLTETTARAHAAELERQRLDKAVLYLQEKLVDLQSKLQGESTRRSDLQISPAWAAGCGMGVNHALQLSDTTKPVVTGKDFIPRVSRDFAAVIRALDADIFSLAKDNEAHLKSEIFFHIGYNIAKDAGLFEASVQYVPEGCWRAFLSALQDNYSDDRFDSAERAADNAQFFYALLFHSGLLTHLTRTELTAAILASLCSTYRSARLQKSIVDDVTSHANTAVLACSTFFHLRNYCRNSCRAVPKRCSVIGGRRSVSCYSKLQEQSFLQGWSYSRGLSMLCTVAQPNLVPIYLRGSMMRVCV